MRQPKNAFDAVRLGAAFLVLVSHAYPLTGQPEAEPLLVLTGGRATLGEMAVYVFFAISGYLVTRSWLADPHLARFMLRRCLRLFPALCLVILASMAILGPAFSALDAGAYFAAPEAWSYLAKVLIFPAQRGLPGVFTDLPYPDVVNGSLWTLRLEFLLYGVVAGAGLCGVLRFRAASVALVLACLAAGLVLTGTEARRLPMARELTLFSLNAIPFLVGAVLAREGADRQAMARAMLVVAVAAAPLLLLGAGRFYLVLLVPFATLLLATAVTCDLTRFGDYSYGVYLWAFPLQQAVAALVPGITSAAMMLLAGLATAGCAALSWHLVERPALALKPGRRPLIAPRVALAE